ncbi:hypothetical protein E4U43_002484 [Claviceps pusilla]|uniref:Uncharacterized protein n=1 Tax=Claviceps pusilla TaxID=123648 RepID=A0A9P7N8P3_9HYPO|nr:hypothetical protein E4U43_002484 [Claviceps pusilla]
MTSGPANVGDAGLEKKVSKNKQSNQSLSKREAAPSSSCRHTNLPDEAYQDASHYGPDTVSKMSKMKISEERARKLGERYGAVFEPTDFLNMAPTETVHRVDKPIRMRVRRVCHRCNTTFAAKNECSKCRHVRCDQCPRHSPSKGAEAADTSPDLEEMEAEAVVEANHENSAILADLFWGDYQPQLKRPSKTGGQDLVHRKPRQRVRRTCHECETIYKPGSKNCLDCGHIRCTDCPRDPPKKDKYPFGYPGDVFGSQTDARFECLSCETLYPPEAEDGTPCQTCGLEKSRESPRTIPRKIQPLPDPAVLLKLQATLAELASSL